MIAGLMQNFARDVIVQLKFKHSRERVIVKIRWGIVDGRLGCGVAKLFAAWCGGSMPWLEPRLHWVSPQRSAIW